MSSQYSASLSGSSSLGNIRRQVQDRNPLGYYNDNKCRLTPVAELNLAKDYNTKINKMKSQYSERKVASPERTFDAALTETLKSNLQNIHELAINSPNYRKTATLTSSQVKEVPFRAKIKRTVLSDVDNINFAPLDMSSLCQTRKQSLINYESNTKEWKPCVRKIDLKISDSKENFETREIKQVRSPTKTNPLLAEGSSVQNQRIRISSPLSSYATDNQAKSLIQNEFGFSTQREHTPKIKNQPIPDQPAKDFRKKKSEFQMKDAIYRGSNKLY